MFNWEHIEQNTVASLKRVASEKGVVVKGTKKADYISALSAYKSQQSQTLPEIDNVQSNSRSPSINAEVASSQHSSPKSISLARSRSPTPIINTKEKLKISNGIYVSIVCLLFTILITYFLME